LVQARWSTNFEWLAAIKNATAAGRMKRYKAVYMLFPSHAFLTSENILGTVSNAGLNQGQHPGLTEIHTFPQFLHFQSYDKSTASFNKNRSSNRRKIYILKFTKDCNPTGKPLVIDHSDQYSDFTDSLQAKLPLADPPPGVYSGNLQVRPHQERRSSQVTRRFVNTLQSFYGFRQT
jgi:hypothetical protein